MTKTTIKYYPVCNGDQALITLSDKTTILIDCNIRESAKGDKDEELYDVLPDLMKSIQLDAKGIPFVDVFILTHGDEDHCRGFETNFYQGDPEKYNNSDKKKDLIRIDAMWFSPMIAEEHTNPDESAYQGEAERRLKLHREKASSKDKPGNRIRIIGYDGSAEYKDLDHLRSIPGDIVSRFNDKDQNTFSIFIHSPFKKQLTTENKDKNSTSIVFQARFRERKEDVAFSVLAIFGGDSDHYAWDTILRETKKSGKDKSEDALKWDIFLSPHHCSWSFFNDRPQEDNKEPKKTSLEVLDYRRGATPKIIASCKKIVVAKPNPPHDAAKKEYVKKVGDANFLNTSINELKGKTPQPIIFEVTSKGPSKIIKSTTGGAITSAGGAGAAGNIVKQGAN